MILLLLAAGVADPDVLIRNAQSLLAAHCEGAECAAPAQRSRFRVDGDEATTITSKDRAIRDDGSKCNVVGARRCPKHGRTIFSTDFTR